MNDFRGHPTFVGMSDFTKRTWNQCNIMLNFNNDGRSEWAEAYHKSLPDVQQRMVKVMLTSMATSGVEAVRRAIQ